MADVCVVALFVVILSPCRQREKSDKEREMAREASVLEMSQLV